MNPFFSPDYRTAQKRFRNASLQIGASLTELNLECSGPEGPSLCIDIAWLGNATPSKMLVHVSGTHGVEGFAGSAVQLKILETPLSLEKDCALVLVHILNPYGMAWLRRTNENNVDLNRNCLDSQENWSGVSPIYQALHSFLNPSFLSRLELFEWKAFNAILKFGFKNVKQALAEGQYEFPQGLFYGGTSLEQGPQLFQQWIEPKVEACERWMVIDFHTGLGKWCHEYLFVPQPSSEVAFFTKAWNKKFIFEPDQNSVGYQIRGGLSTIFQKFHKSGMFVTQELGTYSALKVLKRMREENHHYHHSPFPHRPSLKQQFKQAFCPESMQWRRFALKQGETLIQQALQALQTSVP